MNDLTVFRSDSGTDPDSELLTKKLKTENEAFKIRCRLVF